MALKRVHHIVVRVKDLDQGIASYQAMGLSLERTSENAVLGIKQAYFPPRQGHLVEEEGVSYIADIDADNPLASLLAASCTYRIALGPRAGQKVPST